MIRIEFTEPATDVWKAWCQKCETATAKLLASRASGDDLVFDDTYKGQKFEVYFHLDGPFHGKCAYCESLILADQPGDVEHFRPKGAVTDFEGKQIMIDCEGESKPHSGYYWLAYHWRNLLPACRDCNTITKQKTGNRIGKGNYFPVKNFRAFQPGDEEQEEPLLINPVIDDPCRHLKIDDLGLFEGLTDEGKECIKVFGLNDREALVHERKRTYQGVKEKIVYVTAALLQRNPGAAALVGELQAIAGGKRPYAAAARGAIENGMAVLEPLRRLNEAV